MIMFQKNIIINGLLVKWFNTRASQARIHGFKPRTGYHFEISRQKYLVFLLEKLDINIDDIKNSLEIKANLYCIYIGKTTNRPVSKCLDDHINMHHYESNVTQGFLSTFRQSISSIVSLNQADEESTNEFIDKLKVEYYLSDNPMNSKQLKNELNSIINDSLEKHLYIFKHPRKSSGTCRTNCEKFEKIKKRRKRKCFDIF